MPDQSDMQPLVRIEHRLERIDEYTRSLATRQDIADLRKEMVARDIFEPQLSFLKSQIARVEADRVADKLAFKEELDELRKEQTTRSDRLWMRLGPAIAAVALLITLFEFLTHFKFTP